METKIVPLEKERWKGYVLPMPDYTATEHYAVATEKTKNGFNITLTKKPLAAPRVMTPEEYGMPDGLYADYFSAAEAFGIMREGRSLCMCIFVFCDIPSKVGLSVLLIHITGSRSPTLRIRGNGGLTFLFLCLSNLNNNRIAGP